MAQGGAARDPEGSTGGMLSASLGASGGGGMVRQLTTQLQERGDRIDELEREGERLRNAETTLQRQLVKQKLDLDHLKEELELQKKKNERFQQTAAEWMHAEGEQGDEARQRARRLDADAHKLQAELAACKGKLDATRKQYELAQASVKDLQRQVEKQRREADEARGREEEARRCAEREVEEWERRARQLERRAGEAEALREQEAQRAEELQVGAERRLAEAEARAEQRTADAADARRAAAAQSLRALQGDEAAARGALFAEAAAGGTALYIGLAQLCEKSGHTAREVAQRERGIAAQARREQAEAEGARDQAVVRQQSLEERATAAERRVKDLLARLEAAEGTRAETAEEAEGLRQRLGAQQRQWAEQREEAAAELARLKGQLGEARESGAAGAKELQRLGAALAELEHQKGAAERQAARIAEEKAEAAREAQSERELRQAAEERTQEVAHKLKLAVAEVGHHQEEARSKEERIQKQLQGERAAVSEREAALKAAQAECRGLQEQLRAAQQSAADECRRADSAEAACKEARIAEASAEQRAAASAERAAGAQKDAAEAHAAAAQHKADAELAAAEAAEADKAAHAARADAAKARAEKEAAEEAAAEADSRRRREVAAAEHAREELREELTRRCGDAVRARHAEEGAHLQAQEQGGRARVVAAELEAAAALRGGALRTHIELAAARAREGASAQRAEVAALEQELEMRTAECAELRGNADTLFLSRERRGAQLGDFALQMGESQEENRRWQLDAEAAWVTNTLYAHFAHRSADVAHENCRDLVRRGHSLPSATRAWESGERAARHYLGEQWTALATRLHAQLCATVSRAAAAKMQRLLKDEARQSHAIRAAEAEARDEIARPYHHEEAAIRIAAQKKRKCYAYLGIEVSDGLVDAEGKRSFPPGCGDELAGQPFKTGVLLRRIVHGGPLADYVKKHQSGVQKPVPKNYDLILSVKSTKWPKARTTNSLEQFNIAVADLDPAHSVQVTFQATTSRGKDKKGKEFTVVLQPTKRSLDGNEWQPARKSHLQYGPGAGMRSVLPPSHGPAHDSCANFDGSVDFLDDVGDIACGGPSAVHSVYRPTDASPVRQHCGLDDAGYFDPVSPSGRPPARFSPFASGGSHGAPPPPPPGPPPTAVEVLFGRSSGGR
eukprot:TRINITY_DN4982_c1_g1_i1.p1 TRINITY_DN4982_c1_g1~~TRINITY_DN4982_c1_g1_i1.p1  ORF type:complete len:1174 (+),score=547.74 TRINITY_DN4982_c1_g1_i1:87-3524(+)